MVCFYVREIEMIAIVIINRRYMGEILPIRGKNLFNQSIDKS